MIFFLMNELYKMSSFYMYSLESFVNVINLAIDGVTEKKLNAKTTLDPKQDDGALGEKSKTNLDNSRQEDSNQEDLEKSRVKSA